MEVGEREDNGVIKEEEERKMGKFEDGMILNSVLDISIPLILMLLSKILWSRNKNKKTIVLI